MSLKREMTIEIPRSVSTTALLSRMVAVTAWVEHDEGDDRILGYGHRVHEVVSLITKVVDSYSRMVEAGRGYGLAPTHHEMEALGWHYEGTTTKLDAIIWWPEYNELVEASEVLRTANGAYTITPAPWPREQDEKQLRTVIAELNKGIWPS